MPPKSIFILNCRLHTLYTFEMFSTFIKDFAKIKFFSVDI